MKMLVAFVLFCAVASSQAHLKWKSCGGRFIVITKLVIAQEKITIPGPYDYDLEAEIMRDIPAPIKISVIVKKNGLKLPCIPFGCNLQDPRCPRFGSCVDDDFCKPKYPGDWTWCPLKKYKGSIYHHRNTVSLPPKMPSFIAFLAEGVIEIEVKAWHRHTLLGCIQFTVDLHFDIDACQSSPCQNGGTCTHNVNGYECKCNPGWSGVTCQENINACQSSPCQNGGTCTNKVDRIECKCKPGWTGVICLENINECQSSPCQNGGTCIDKVNRFECNCTRGWTGITCLEDKEKELREQIHVLQNKVKTQDSKISTLQEQLKNAELTIDKLEKECTHGTLPVCEGYEIVNGRYVKYFDRKMTWQSAKDFCESSSLQLITVKDEKTAEWLKGQQKPIWIGACDLGHEGKWTWVDGTQVEDGNWNADEPNNGLGIVDENCAVVNSMFYPWWDHGKWADRACSLQKQFACETVRCPDLKILS